MKKESAGTTEKRESGKVKIKKKVGEKSRRTKRKTESKDGQVERKRLRERKKGR